jgi:3-oxoacyl-[acyl-carrier-protein] synthase II
VAAALSALIGDQSADSTIDCVVSAATGCAGPTREEASVLDGLGSGVRRVALGDVTGHGVEAAFPAAVALAAGLIEAGEGANALVTGVGHWRGEGIARLSRAV